MIEIKQYGAMRSGTNYLKWLITNNFNNVTVNTSKGGHKHGPHELSDVNINIIISIKNPYALYISEAKRISKYGTHKKSWMDCPFNSIKIRPINDSFFHKYISLYSLYQLILLKNKNSMFVNTEKLSLPHKEKDSVMTQIQHCFHLSKKTNNNVWVYADKKISIALAEEQPRELPHIDFDNNYYNEQKYMQAYTKDDFSHINAILEPAKDMLNFYNYTIYK